MSKSALNVLGKHTIIDLYDCNREKIDDLALLEETLLRAAKAANATIINSHFHKFSPQGVSGTIIIAESHFNLHSWPEHGYVALDLFTCGTSLDSSKATEILIEELESKNYNIQELDRGKGFKTSL